MGSPSASAAGHTGHTRAPDVRRAAQLYAKAAERGSARGQNNLGVLYFKFAEADEADLSSQSQFPPPLHSHQQPQPRTAWTASPALGGGEGEEKTRRAQKGGSRVAELRAVTAAITPPAKTMASIPGSMGGACGDGDGGGTGGDDDSSSARGFELAAELLEKAARQGLPEAASNLGRTIELGRGVRQDERVAMEWYAFAAEHGSSSGMCHRASLLVKKASDAAAVRGATDPSVALCYAAAVRALETALRPEQAILDGALGRNGGHFSDSARAQRWVKSVDGPDVFVQGGVRQSETSEQLYVVPV